MSSKVLAGEVALVTGASRGIGAAIADALADAGARVIGTATTAAGAAAIGERLAARGGEGRVLDVAQPGAAESLVDALTPATGAVTILVNNAGITRDQLLLRMKDQDWAEVLETNLSGAFRLSRAVLRGMMKARRGRIISIASVIASIGNPGQANYAAAKAGLVGFTRSLAREVGSRGITVNVVAPGYIETDMTRQLPDAVRQSMIDATALGRAGTPAEVAAAVLFLASPAAAYITGTTLHVNGGLYMGG